ncbi:Nn.00g028100.m01.CDS01 [Neocucurbitaria sp. VM-36]
MANNLVVVVTGSNRGVGKGIVELLAKQQLQRPLTIYATSRSGEDTKIHASSPNEIRYEKLDITDYASIQTLFEKVLKEQTAIDILINNAAVSNDYRETPEYAAETVRTNYGGTRDMCKAFLAQPNLRPGSRIANVTSGYNRLATYGQAIQDRFRSASAVSDLDSMADAYLDAVRRGQPAQEEDGWGSGSRSYKVSKALNNAITILLAKKNPDILINNCCPGWTDTAMGNQARGKPPKTPEEGARIPTRLAIGNLGPQGDEDGGLGQDTEKVSGHFFENDNIMATGWGKAKLWLEL